MFSNRQSSFIFVLSCLLLLAFYPLFAGQFGVDLVSKIMIYAIFALSLELLVGRTGLVCFGHSAFFGIGAYAVVLFSGDGSVAPSLIIMMLLSILTAGAYALFMGALSLRTKGVYFIMVTLAFAQMAYYIFHDTPIGGGTDGIYLLLKPVLSVGDTVLIDLDNANVFYWFTLFCLAAVMSFLALLMRSRLGHALVGIKSNEQRMRATGFSTYPYKLAAFVISGCIAGLAGFLFGVKDAYVNPELLSWHLSGAVLIMIILGGLGHLRGALLGAFAFALLQELFKSEAIFGAFAKHWQLGLGLTIIACVAWLPNGLIELPSRVLRRLGGPLSEPKT